MDEAMVRILLVDDDDELAGMLKEYLDKEGFETIVVADGTAGITEALSGRYALAVIDVMMPGTGGFDVLRQIRAQSSMPVLMLTAKGDDIDRIVGLEMGADDYVPKPCTPRELVARIRAILRRTQTNISPDERTIITVGPLTLWPQRRTVEVKSEPLSLTSTEFSLLEILVRNAGCIVSKRMLAKAALGRPLSPFDRSIDVHISSIRHKLGDRDDGLVWIQTVRGQGYQFTKE
jgi:two-component system OmpR family response regulator